MTTAVGAFGVSSASVQSTCLYLPSIRTLVSQYPVDIRVCTPTCRVFNREEWRKELLQVVGWGYRVIGVRVCDCMQGGRRDYFGGDGTIEEESTVREQLLGSRHGLCGWCGWW